MRVLFMGTPLFAATILEELAFQHEVVGVCTAPDKIRSRGSEADPSPVKRVALKLDIPVFEPESLRNAATIESLAGLRPDVVCVAAYAKILPNEILEMAPYGALNVHASLLPRWRGAAPIERAILAGDEQSGVCIMRMGEGLDTGDYCICRSTFIGDKSADELSDELANLGAAALVTALEQIQAGRLFWSVQDESEATYAEKIRKGELDISPDGASKVLARRVQASSETHPSHCQVAGRGVSVLSAEALRGSEVDALSEALGSPLEAGKAILWRKHLLLGCSDGVLEIFELKPDGKRAMDAIAFAAGVQGMKSGVEWGSYAS